MPSKNARIHASLLKKGSRASQGDHGCFISYTLDGKKTPVRTKTSHTPKMKDVPDPLLGEMGKPCRLTRPRFLELIDCSLDQPTYEDRLRDQGTI